MSHFEKVASVLAFSIAAALAATGCAAPSGDDGVDGDDYVVEATPQGGFQEGFQKGGFQKGFEKGFSKSSKGGGYFSKVPSQAPIMGYSQSAPAQAPSVGYSQSAPSQAPSAGYSQSLPSQAPTTGYGQSQ